MASEFTDRQTENSHNVAEAINIPKRPRYDFADDIKNIRAIEREMFDRVFCHSSETGSLAAIACLNAVKLRLRLTRRIQAQKAKLAQE